MESDGNQVQSSNNIDQAEMIISLKNKITELYVISETANQECLLSEQKLTSLKYDLRIAAKTRDFYDERQIKTAEINKSLQNELTQSKTDSITYSTHMNRLGIENKRINCDLVELQRRLSSDKNSLANHLDRIERHIRKQSMGKENIDVNYIKNELEQRKSHIDVLRNENHKLTERLTTSEEHIQKNSSQFLTFESDIADLKITTEKLKIDISTRDLNLTQISAELENTKNTLASTTEGKIHLDTAYSDLQLKLSALTTNVQQNDQQLILKDQRLATLKNENEMYAEQGNNVSHAETEYNTLLEKYDNLLLTYNETVEKSTDRDCNNSDEIIKLKYDLEVEKDNCKEKSNMLIKEKAMNLKLKNKLKNMEKNKKTNVDKTEMAVQTEDGEFEFLTLEVHNINKVNQTLEDLNTFQLSNNQQLDEELQNELRNAEEMSNKYEDEIKQNVQLQINLKELATKHEELQVKFAELESNEEQVKEQNIYFQTEFKENYEYHMSEANFKLSSLEELNSRHVTDYQQLEHKMNIINQKYQDVVSNKADKDRQYTELEGNADKMKCKMMQLKGDVTNITKTNKKLHTTIDKYKATDESLKYQLEELNKLNFSLQEVNSQQIEDKFGLDQDLQVKQNELDRILVLLNQKQTNNVNEKETCERLSLMLSSVSEQQEQLKDCEDYVIQSFNRTYDTDRHIRSIADKTSFIDRLIEESRQLYEGVEDFIET